MKKLSLLPFLMLLSSIFLISACSSQSSAAEGDNPEAAAQTAAEDVAEPEKSVPVEVAVVETGDISLIFSYSGSLQPRDELNVVPGAAGRIESVLVEEGDIVKVGDPIAIIEDDIYQTQVKQAEAGLATAKLNLAKMELGSRPEEIAAAQAAVELAKASLNDVSTIDDDERTQAASALARAEANLRSAQAEYDKIAWAGDVGTKPQALALQDATIAYETALSSYNQQTNPSDSQLAPLMLQVAQAELALALKLQPFRQVDLATAQAGIQQAEAAVEAAKIQLKETIITAPFNGVIADLSITEGSQVSQGTPIAHLISQDLEAQVGVQESLISQVEQGQSASLNVTAYPGQDFPAVVTSVAPTADSNSRNFAVKVTPTDGQDLLRSGMFADVSILAQENKNTILAPREAVIQSDEPYVYVVQEDDTVEQRTVTTGLFDTERVEILSGLKPGDVVVVTGQPNLQDGTQADVVNDPRIAD